MTFGVEYYEYLVNRSLLTLEWNIMNILNRA